jgi:hypothetical protein
MHRTAVSLVNETKQNSCTLKQHSQKGYFPPRSHPLSFPLPLISDDRDNRDTVTPPTL